MNTRKFAYIFNESAPSVSEAEILENGHRVTAKAVLQTGNQKNRNGRIYRTADLAEQIAAPRQVELLKTKNMLGEAGHPMTTELIRQQTIDPKSVCVRFLEFWMEGDNVMGKFKGTNNDLGNAFDMDLREGVRPAFSYRALGTVSETPQGAIVENLKMITYDYVIYPSHPTAYTQGLVSESAVGNSSIIKSNLTSLVENTKLDASTSFVHSFTNEQVIQRMEELKCQKEAGAIDYIKDMSKNFNLLQEAYDISSAANIDLIGGGKIAITESGIGVIHMDIEDYINKEIQNYTRY